MQHVDIALNRNRTTRGNDFFKLELHSHQEKYLKFGMTDYIKCGRVSLLRKTLRYSALNGSGSFQNLLYGLLSELSDV